MKFQLAFFTALSCLSLLFTACGGASADNISTDTPQAEATTPDANLPATLQKILDAHGGLANWQSFRQLSYALPNGETQLVDLYDRREYILQPAADGGQDIQMGFDGTNVWITADTTYKGNPLFYKNLMFYFYAMPWVLADPGIVYTEAEPLVYNGVTYPGILVSYDDGIGFSPKDNYRLHYDAATHEMRWLGYTVTGNSGKSSNKYSWIAYPTWSDHGGIQLADSLVWYTTQNNQPIDVRNARVFSEVKLTKTAAPDKAFARPDGARIVE